MAGVALEDVTKVYDDGTVAVSNLALDIEDGEFMVLVGPSGCGKTTALRMVAGLETITAGEVRIAERVVNRVPPKDRDIAMVFQNYALYPHLTVADNLGFSLRLHKVPRAEIKRRVTDIARILGLEDLLNRKPRALSGGQRQRVAMGRAIVRDPEAFLMDEPLSNLDAKLRVQMRAEIARIQHDLGTTTIYVTHDQTEAMTMGDRVAVMRRGELQQVDHPQALYEHPVNLFVGGFIGSPAMNLVEGVLEHDDEQSGVLWARLGEQRLRLADSLLADRPTLHRYAGRGVAVGIRPEDLKDASMTTGPADGQRLRVSVGLVERMGAETYVHFTLDAKPVFTEDTRELVRERAEMTDNVLEQRGQAPHSECVARVQPRTEAREGEQLELAVDTSHVYFFDLETGQAIDDAASPAPGAAPDGRGDHGGTG